MYVSLGTPTEADGRLNVVNAPMSKGWWTWFTGAGDDLNPTPPDSGRGSGTKMNLDFTGPATKDVVIDLLEPVEVHDGQLTYSPVDNWTHDDRFDFKVRMPANQVTPNGGGTGNCNLVDTGEGYNVLVPSFGGPGGYDIDLDAAVPVDASDAGYWDVDRDTGAVTPTAKTPGTAGWHLLDMQIEIYFMRNMPMGHPLGVLDIDAYKSEWIHNNWKLVIEVTKTSAGAGTLSAWMLWYRKNVT